MGTSMGWSDRVGMKYHVSLNIVHGRTNLTCLFNQEYESILLQFVGQLVPTKHAIPHCQRPLFGAYQGNI